MKQLAIVLRIYSFAFHLTLGVFLLSVAALSTIRHSRPVALDVLPFNGPDLLREISLLGAAGIVCSLFALTRFFRFAFVIWNAAFFYLLVKAFFFGPFAVQGSQDMKGALWLAFGALGAFFGAAWPQRSTHRALF